MLLMNGRLVAVRGVAGPIVPLRHKASCGVSVAFNAKSLFRRDCPAVYEMSRANETI
jgi:hypothetical protein